MGMLESKRKTALAFLLAAVLASAAAYFFLQGVARVQSQMGAEQLVLVAARPIPAQIPIQEADLARRPVASKYLLPGLMTDPEEVLGQVALAPVAEGEPLIRGLIRPLDDLPPGQRILSLVSGERVVVEPGLGHGDRVDILASYSRDGAEVTEVYLQDVPIVAFRQGEDRVMVSLRLSLEEARRLVYIENYGRQLHLLRRPAGEGEAWSWSSP